MPASQKTKWKEATRESSRKGCSSLSLLLSDNNDNGEAEGLSAKKYHTKCQIEKDIINTATQRALVAKTNNGGWMPDESYTNYTTELKQTPAGCRMVIATEDIKNRVRA